MGFFKDLEIDVIDMFRVDGMKETEIATATGLPVAEVHRILAAYENNDMDYDITDTDAEMVSYDDLQFEPSEPEDYE